MKVKKNNIVHIQLHNEYSICGEYIGFDCEETDNQVNCNICNEIINFCKKLKKTDYIQEKKKKNNIKFNDYSDVKMTKENKNKIVKVLININTTERNDDYYHHYYCSILLLDTFRVKYKMFNITTKDIDSSNFYRIEQKIESDKEVRYFNKNSKNEIKKGETTIRLWCIKQAYILANKKIKELGYDNLNLVVVLPYYSNQNLCSECDYFDKHNNTCSHPIEKYRSFKFYDNKGEKI